VTEAFEVETSGYFIGKGKKKHSEEDTEACENLNRDSLDARSNDTRNRDCKKEQNRGDPQRGRKDRHAQKITDQFHAFLPLLIKSDMPR